MIEIRIRDHGPGLPESELEKVFEPFYRLETSRNRETGGTGLVWPSPGTCCAASGSIRLRNTDGGLEAIVLMPRCWGPRARTVKGARCTDTFDAPAPACDSIPSRIAAPRHHIMPAFWMLVSITLLFAVMGVCVKIASETFSTAEVVLYRGAVSMLMMVSLARARSISLRTPHWRMHVSRSLSGSIALSCYFFAIGILPLATAVTLNYTSPIFSSCCSP